MTVLTTFVKRANVVLHVGLCKEIFARKHTATHKPKSAQPLTVTSVTSNNRLWSPKGLRPSGALTLAFAPIVGSSVQRSEHLQEDVRDLPFFPLSLVFIQHCTLSKHTWIGLTTLSLKDRWVRPLNNHKQTKNTHMYRNTQRCTQTQTKTHTHTQTNKQNTDVHKCTHLRVSPSQHL